MSDQGESEVVRLLREAFDADVLMGRRPFGKRLWLKPPKKATPKARIVAPKASAETAKPEAPKIETPKPETPAERDQRLPPVGTKIDKRDRHGEVRCSCEVIEGGVRYKGTTFKSLSGAAMAAAKDLGLTNKTQNGFVFWGLTKPPRPVTDPVEALQRAWDRYHARVKATVAATPEDAREKVRKEVEKQAAAIDALAKKAA